METYWSKTAAGTNSGATATQASDESRGWVITWISGHVDADSIIKITDGTTTLWESKVDVSVSGIHFHFDNLTIPTGIGNSAVGNIAASGSDCQVTIGGTSAP